MGRGTLYWIKKHVVITRQTTLVMEEEMIVLSSNDDADMLHICSDGSCLMSMHPYFSGELLQIESETMDTLTTENKSIVKKLFEVSQLITVCDTD